MAVRDLEALRWPAPAIDHALRRLAALAHLSVGADVPTTVAQVSAADLPGWVGASATAIGLEAAALEVPYAELAETLTSCGPAIVALPGTTDLLAIAGGRGRELSLISHATGRIERVGVDVVCDAIVREPAQGVGAAFDTALHGLPRAPLERARRALVSEALRARRLDTIWLVRAPASAPLWVHARSEALPRRAVAMLLVHATLMLLTILGWTVLGRGALAGRLESSWSLAWGLMLASYVPLYIGQAWIRGKLAVDFGRLLKRRLLQGAMRIDDEVVRREGAGALVGRALEANAIDNLAATSGLTAALAVLELGPICAWLALGSGGAPHALALLAVIGVLALLALVAHRRTRAWTGTRRRLTLELIEKMVGHRTRLAQCAPQRWHDGEDPLLARYADEGKAVDRVEVWLQTIPTAWLALGLLAIAPGFVRGDAPLQLAIALGGTALGFASLSQVSAGLRPLVEAIAGFCEVAPLYRAADTARVDPSPAIAVLPPRRRTDGPALLLAASGVSVRYPGRARAVLEDVSLTIAHGDRILLEGPSGGGKTTLAAVLAGLMPPSSGLLLLDGFDHPTLGDAGWRRRIAVAAQYHDNHVFADTFIFNAMLGHPSWPPTRDDVARVRKVCSELGLDDLLGRMAAGVAQNVGEGGWRLSHGERSRLFIARALLQDSPLVILDESFAALDPETLARCLSCVLARAETLVVIAHP